VAVLATGSELRDLAEPAAPGREVVASNGYMLAAQVAEWGGLPDRRPPVGDDPEALVRAVRSAEAPVVVTTAGTGRGVHDFLTAVWAALRAEVVVPGVAIRPGSTTRVARLGERILLGLPGGPGAAWAAFHALVGPALWAWGGVAAEPLAVRAALAEVVSTEAGVTHLIRGRLMPAGEGWRFAPARTGATGVAILEGTDREIAAGAVVRVELLPPRPAPGTE
jgi:molybdenum cofactor synthesis domain-containing protein